MTTNQDGDGFDVHIPICIRNKGVAESLAEDFEMPMIGKNGQEIRLKAAPFLEAFGVSVDGELLSVEPTEDISEKAFTPIKAGGIVRGWALFRVTGQADAIIGQGISTKVFFRDINGTQHVAEAGKYCASGPHLKKRPGMKLQWGKLAQQLTPPSQDPGKGGPPR